MLAAPLFTFDSADCGFTAQELDMSFFSDYLIDNDEVEKSGFNSFLGKLYTYFELLVSRWIVMDTTTMDRRLGQATRTGDSDRRLG